MRKPKEKINLEYRGFKNDSMSEVWFLQWLECLEREGFISNISRADTYTLTTPVYKEYEERKKTKTNVKNEPLLQGCDYTPDFKFFIEEKGRKLDLFKDINSKDRLFQRNKFTFVTQNNWCIVEIKGTKFRVNNSSETKAEFKVKQKVLYKDQGVYVNLVTPDTLFPLTYTPKEYLYTKVKKLIRKIPFKVVTFETWLKTQNIN